MVTRPSSIRPAAEPMERRQAPPAVKALVPDGQQREIDQLVSDALRKRYGGWEFTITVKEWAPDHVLIVIDAFRPPGSSAPPAPPSDSPAAAEWVSLLDTLLEQRFRHWDFEVTYLRKSPDEGQLICNGRRSDNGDPPTCADAAPTEPPLLLSRKKHDAFIIANPAPGRKPWCFLHFTGTQPLAPPLVLQPIGSTAVGNVPADCRNYAWSGALPTALVNGSQISLAANQTFAYKIPSGYQVSIAANQLPNCIVWWQAP